MDELTFQLFPYLETSRPDVSFPEVVEWLAHNIEVIHRDTPMCACFCWSLEAGHADKQWNILFDEPSLAITKAISQHDRLEEQYRLSPAQFRFAEEQDALLFRMRWS